MKREKIIVSKDGSAILVSVVASIGEDYDGSPISFVVDGSERTAKLFFVEPDGSHCTTVCTAYGCDHCTADLYPVHCPYGNPLDRQYFEV